MKSYNKSILFTLFSSVFALFLFIQCETPSNTSEDTELGEQSEMLEDDVEQMEANWEEEAQEWKSALQTRMDKVEQEIEAASGDTQAELQEEMSELEQNMERINNATEEEWKEIKTELEELDEIEVEIETNS